MGKKMATFKIEKNENSEILLVHCAINREIYLSQNTLPVFNEVLKSHAKLFNEIRANAYRRYHFQKFCNDKNADSINIFFHIEVN